MKRWPLALLLALGASIFGATVVREPIASAVQTVRTQKIFDESFTQGGLSATIDVSPYRQIRIVGRCFDPGGTMNVSPFLVYGDNPDFDVAALGDLDVPCNTGSSATYESPGQTIRISVGAGSGRVVIYGRVN